MQATREEIMDVFRKWLAEGTLLKCNVSLGDVAVCLRGRVIAIDGDTVRVLSDVSEGAFTFREGCRFGFGDPRDFPEERRVFGDAVVVLMPPDWEDTFVFSEIL